ncbi:MAG: 4Fe-4S dicluster domain-containing protein, partial [Phycicoccus sp.]
ALADEYGRQALRCIRCSACLNVCPVYERVGGHAYGSVYPGPIGAVLNPLLRGPGHDPGTDALPFASTLCGACADVCPVDIDLPGLLVDLRAQVVDAHRGRSRPDPEALVMRSAAWVLGDSRRTRLAQRAAGLAARVRRRPVAGQTRAMVSWLPFPGSRWTTARDLPVPPRESFGAWWRRRGRDETPQDGVERPDARPG